MIHHEIYSGTVEYGYMQIFNKATEKEEINTLEINNSWQHISIGPFARILSVRQITLQEPKSNIEKSNPESG